MKIVVDSREQCPFAFAGYDAVAVGVAVAVELFGVQPAEAIYARGFFKNFSGLSRNPFLARHYF